MHTAEAPRHDLHKRIVIVVTSWSTWARRGHEEIEGLGQPDRCAATEPL